MLISSNSFIITKRKTYVNRPEPRPMTRRHTLIESPHRIRAAQLPELLIHVMRPTPRVIPNPNPKVLHLQGLTLRNARHADDLAVRLFDFLELAQEGPEARFGDDGVGCEDAHAVEFWGGVL